VLEVEPAGLCGEMVTEGGRNSNEAVAGAALEAFAKWLYNR